jgi:predicted DNA-binding transcriptional regulator YafY
MFPVTAGYFCEQTLRDYLKYERGVNGRDVNYFNYRHVHYHPVIEEQVLWEIMNAMHQKRKIILNYHSPKDQTEQGTRKVLCPFRFRYDVRHGRIYLISFSNYGKCVVSRLDRIESVEVLDEVFNRADFDEAYQKQMCCSWSSVSLDMAKKPELVKLEITVEEPVESYILEKIISEVPNGTLEKIGSGCYHLSFQVNDSGELIPWIRGYAGYIRVLESSVLANRLLRDWKEMLAAYGIVQ